MANNADADKNIRIAAKIERACVFLLILYVIVLLYMSCSVFAIQINLDKFYSNIKSSPKQKRSSGLGYSSARMFLNECPYSVLYPVI